MATRRILAAKVAKAALEAAGATSGPQMQTVNSSAVAAIGYNGRSRVLTVQWIKGGTYEYSGVSRDLHANLLDSNSIGETMNYIKRSIPGRKVG